MLYEADSLTKQLVNKIGQSGKPRTNKRQPKPLIRYHEHYDKKSEVYLEFMPVPQF